MENKLAYTELEKTIRNLKTENELLKSKQQIFEASLGYELSYENYVLLFSKMISGFALFQEIIKGHADIENFRLKLANPAFNRLFDIEQISILDKSINEILPELTTKKIKGLCNYSAIKEQISFDYYSPSLNKYFEVFAYKPKPDQIATIINDITDKKLAENALQKSNDIFRDIVSNVREYIYSVEFYNGKVINTYHSPQCEHITGYTVDEYRKDPFLWLKMLHPEDEQKVYDILNERNIKKTANSYEHRITHKNGSIKWVINTCTIQTDNKGNIIRESGFIVDITRRKNAEIELAKSKQFLESIIESAKDGIVIMDVNQRLTNVNKAFLTMTGYTEDEFEEINYKAITPKSWHEKNNKYFTDLLNTGKDFTIENEYIRKDGSTFFALYSGALMHYKSENSSTIIGVIKDITEIKKTEKALNESRIKYKEFAELLPQTVFELDIKGNFIFVNNNGLKQFGYLNKEYKDNLNIFNLFPSERATKVQKLFHRRINGSKNEMSEYVAIKKDGSPFPVSVYSNIVYKDNLPVSITGIAIDMSEQKRIEKKLKDAKTKAEESDRLKSAFLSNMSHEIRTPMNSIIGFTRLLNYADLPSDITKEYLSIIEKNSNQLLKLIEDIIDIAKIEAGEIKTKFSHFNLVQTLKTILSAAETDKVMRGKPNLEIRLNVKDKDADFLFYSDITRFQQILFNLIGNSIKFTDSGFVEFGYSFDKKDNKDVIIFYVKDSGPGIDKSQLNYVFTRFGKIETNNFVDQGGTGLGLAIVKNLTEILNGKIWLKTEPNIGTTFFVSLPNLTIKEEQITEIKRHSDVINKKWINKTILIVEDNKDNFNLIKAILKDTELKILHVSNGKTAIELCALTNKIDLVLMDIKMPVMNGYKALKHIKEHNKSLPVIAQTAYAMINEKEKLLLAGFDEYITKPIIDKKLIAIIDKFL